MKRKRISTVLVLILVLMGMGSLAVRAAETEEVPEEIFDAVEQLPEEIRTELPSGIGSRDFSEFGDAVAEMTSWEYLSELFWKVMGAEMGSTLRLLAILCALLMLAAVFGTLCTSLGSDSLSGAFRFCTTAAIFSAMIHIQLRQMENVRTFFERLNSLMESMIPVLGSLWAMGGNVTTASAGTGTLYIFLAVCRRICAAGVLPICSFCTVAALCNTLSPQSGMRGIGGAVKKVYTFSLGLMMTILLTVLSSQTTLTASADSVTAKTAKTFSSAIIPIVGGSVGETLRTLASGIQYMKGVVGIGGVGFLLLLVLPTFLSLVFTRLAFLLAGGVAELLGCDAESRLLGELGGIYGIMLAVVSMSSVMFILALQLFIKTAVAVG